MLLYRYSKDNVKREKNTTTSEAIAVEEKAEKDSNEPTVEKSHRYATNYNCEELILLLLLLFVFKVLKSFFQ